MRPYWMIRTISGMSMDLGITLLVYNLMRTALAGYNSKSSVVFSEIKVA